MSGFTGFPDTEEEMIPSQATFRQGKIYYLQGQYPQAFVCFQNAANQGVMEAQYNLGACYANGVGVAEDEKVAMSWYRKAADQGHVLAQCCLGAYYASGTGVVKDEKEAVSWYRKAENNPEVATVQKQLNVFMQSIINALSTLLAEIGVLNSEAILPEDSLVITPERSPVITAVSDSLLATPILKTPPNSPVSDLRLDAEYSGHAERQEGSGEDACIPSVGLKTSEEKEQGRSLFHDRGVCIAEPAALSSRTSAASLRPLASKSILKVLQEMNTVPCTSTTVLVSSPE